jgi:hypothetical protein
MRSKGRGLEAKKSRGDSGPVKIGFVGNVYHRGFPLGVQMREVMREAGGITHDGSRAKS